MHGNYFSFLNWHFWKWNLWPKFIIRNFHVEKNCIELPFPFIFLFQYSYSPACLFWLFLHLGMERKKKWIICKLENLASAHLPNTKSCGVARGYGHFEFISEAISYIKSMCTGSLRIFISIPFCFSPGRHHSGRKDRVSFQWWSRPCCDQLAWKA